MTEILYTTAGFVPDGILHDQKTKLFSYDGKTLRFVFDLEWFWDYDGNEILEKYKGYKTCVLELEPYKDSDITFVNLWEFKTKGNKFGGIEISLDDFINIAKNDSVTVGYSSIYVSDVGIMIELSFCAEKGKYKKYGCAELHTQTEQIKFIWE